MGIRSGSWSPSSFSLMFFRLTPTVLFLVVAGQLVGLRRAATRTGHFTHRCSDPPLTWRYIIYLFIYLFIYWCAIFPRDLGSCLFCGRPPRIMEPGFIPASSFSFHFSTLMLNPLRVFTLRLKEVCFFILWELRIRHFCLAVLFYMFSIISACREKGFFCRSIPVSCRVLIQDQ